MSILDFLREEREEKKKRRQLQKEQKKGKKTKEEKKRKVFGILTFVILAFGIFFYCCSGISDGYDWNEIIGITEEMIIELEKPVDESKLFTNDKISEMDWLECNNILLDAGIDFEKSEDNAATKSFVLNNKQVGALSKKLLSEVENSLSLNIYDMEFYAIGEVIYQKSIMLLDLSKIIVGSKLPSVYLTTISKVEVLSNSLICLSNEIVINNIAEDKNKEILEVLNNSSNKKLEKVTNEVVDSLITIFAKGFNLEMVLSHGQIEFRV